MSIKFNLHEPVTKKEWPNIPPVHPFLAKNLNNGLIKVIIRVCNSYLFLEDTGGMSQSGDKNYVETDYEFIRFLTRDDSITFTG